MMFSLIDGNAFFVSCERLFRPDIKDKAVVVLSNNDGCVVARSNEAKALGIKMGTPYFQLAEKEKKHDIVVFSSNYELYGDISSRMMQSIASLLPQTEVYSIDECFADVSGFHNLNALGLNVINRVQQWVGIPTCVGTAPSKTLAKFCNHLAKKHAVFKGVVVWNDWSAQIQERALKSEDLTAIWGIGPNTGAKLHARGIKTAWDFYQAPTALIKKYFGLAVERTQRELHGWACEELQNTTTQRAQIISSRSFKHDIQDIESLRSALSFHITQASTKLRRQQSLCLTLSIFIKTNRFKKQEEVAQETLSIRLFSPTADTLILNSIALELLEKLYQTHTAYKKCGVALSDIVPENTYRQLDCFDDAQYIPTLNTRPALMQAMDHIHQKYGLSSIRLASELSSPNMPPLWQMRRDKKSPAYTTRWMDLPCI